MLSDRTYNPAFKVYVAHLPTVNDHVSLPPLVCWDFWTQLLAEAILHHKVMYGFIMPMHGQFLQSEQDNSSAGGSSQQDLGGCKLRLQLQDTDWMHNTVQLAQKSAPVLQRTLEVGSWL